MLSSLSAALLALGFILVVAGLTGVGVIVATLGALWEFYIFYKSGT